MPKNPEQELAKLTATQLLSVATQTAKDVMDKAVKTAEILKKDADRNQQSINIDVMATDISYIKRDTQEIKQKLERDYVTRDQFAPVRNIAFGLVATILMAVIGAILALVLK